MDSQAAPKKLYYLAYDLSEVTETKEQKADLVDPSKEQSPQINDPGLS